MIQDDKKVQKVARAMEAVDLEAKKMGVHGLESFGSQFSLRFACVRLRLCFWKCLRRNLRTWKVNYISVAPWCLQIPVPVKLFIPSSYHNFGCMSSEVSGGLLSSRTAKPWHFRSQFKQWRRRWEQFAQRNLFLCIRKSRVLLTEREVRKHAP